MLVVVLVVEEVLDVIDLEVELKCVTSCCGVSFSRISVFCMLCRRCARLLCTLRLFPRCAHAVS